MCGAAVEWFSLGGAHSDSEHWMAIFIDSDRSHVYLMLDLAGNEYFDTRSFARWFWYFRTVDGESVEIGIKLNWMDECVCLCERWVTSMLMWMIE